jgi:DNA gyrase subunit A
MGRNTQGVRLVRLDEGDSLVAAIPVERDPDEEEEETVKPEFSPEDEVEIPEEEVVDDEEIDDDENEVDEDDDDSDDE